VQGAIEVTEGVCVCVCVYIHIYVYTYICIYIHECIFLVYLLFRAFCLVQCVSNCLEYAIRK